MFVVRLVKSLVQQLKYKFMDITARKFRHRRIRSRLSGSASKPRVSVLRSARGITAQLIDDTAGHTLLTASTHGLTVKGKVAQATELGNQLAAAAKAAGITTVVFDRSGYLYHGRIKALAEGLRAGGLTV